MEVFLRGPHCNYWESSLITTWELGGDGKKIICGFRVFPATIWITDAHRGDGKRFVVRADENLTAFLELESAVLAYSRLA